MGGEIEIGGRSRKLTLGPAIDQDVTELASPALGNALTLAGARKLAAEAMFAVRQGGDPAAERKETKAKARQAAPPPEDMDLRAAVEQYFRREGKNLRSAKERRAIFDRLILPKLGDRPVSAIRRSEIVQLLDEIEERGPVIADAALAALRRLLNWFASRSDEFRSPIVRGMARSRTA